ncbi:MAG: hypothetical protein Q9198_007108 [Flavoplaca austrocitrina]
MNNDIVDLDNDDIMNIDRDQDTTNTNRDGTAPASEVMTLQPHQDISNPVADQDDLLLSTPHLGVHKQEPQRPESPNTINAHQANNAFNKAILAMSDLELDDSFKQLANADGHKDKLRDILKNDLGRSTNKVEKAQSTNTSGTKVGTIPKNHDATLMALGQIFHEASTGAKAVIGTEILAKMKDARKRKTLVDLAQRLGVFCGLFTVGSIFYLVDVLDNDTNLLAIKIKGRATELGYARLREWNIEDQAKQSGMQKLAEDILGLITQGWKVRNTEDDDA